MLHCHVDGRYHPPWIAGIACGGGPAPLLSEKARDAMMDRLATASFAAACLFVTAVWSIVLVWGARLIFY
jgi:hypothetical protein